MAPNRHASHPSQRAFVQTFEAGFLAFGAGDTRAVALDVSTATSIAGVGHGILLDIIET